MLINDQCKTYNVNGFSVNQGESQICENHEMFTLDKKYLMFHLLYVGQYVRYFDIVFFRSVLAVRGTAISTESDPESEESPELALVLRQL